MVFRVGFLFFSLAPCLDLASHFTVESVFESSTFESSMEKLGLMFSLLVAETKPTILPLENTAVY